MVNDSIDNLRLDINKPKARVSLSVRKGDTKSRTIHVALTSNGAVYSLANVLMAELLITKPDGKVCDQDMVIKNNELQYTFRTQDTNVTGECTCQIRLTFKDNAYLISPEFYMYVYTMILDQNTSKSENEYSQTDALLTKANEYYENAESLATTVSETVTASSKSASEAAESASEAQTYFTDAKNYAESAEDYMDKAADYCTNAKTAQTAAETAQSAAETAKSAAETLKTETESIKEATQAIKDATDNSVTEAAAYAKAAESYAHGDTGARSGESVDNSKYYSSLSLNYANNAKVYADKIEAQYGFMQPDFTIDDDGIMYVDINPAVTFDFTLDDDCVMTYTT